MYKFLKPYILARIRSHDQIPKSSVFSEESVSRVEIDLVFRTFSDEGILFYADGGRTSTASSPPMTPSSAAPAAENDFISLAVVQGYVEFRYDLGSGVPLILRSASPVKLGHWHHVVAKRYHQVTSVYNCRCVV
jgi:coxsackievirus/adenovirus receptor